MNRHSQNAKWLTYFAPFRALSVSTAYLVPFFQLHGLDLSQIFLLQSIFSVAYVVWEIPSGLIADRYGRALSIKLSAPILALAMILYGFSTSFWQFAACELMLALANGLISGVDTALLIDSLKADHREDEFVKISQRINAYGFAATGFGVPIAILLVQFVSLSSTLVADGLLTLVGVYFARQLVEAPAVTELETRLPTRHALLALGRKREVRYLITLGSALSAATYLGFWLSASYYTRLGIPTIWFSAILAVRSLWKAWLARHITQEKYIERNMLSYALIALVVYLAMASGQVWLVWIVLGHDVVQALQTQPITAALNEHIAHRNRATMNSAVNMMQRLLYSTAGPLVGLLADKAGLATAFVVTGLVCTAASLYALNVLHSMQTFTLTKRR